MTPSLRRPCAPRAPSPGPFSRQHHGQRSGVAATPPGRGPHTGLTADGGVLAVVVVPHDRLGHGAPHGRPGSGHRVAAQVHHVRRDLRPAPRPPHPEGPGSPGSGPGQSAEHGGGSSRPPPGPFPARATGSEGVGAAGLHGLRPQRLTWARGCARGVLGVVVRTSSRRRRASSGRRAPRHAGSCSLRFLAEGTARGEHVGEGGYCLPKKKPRPTSVPERTLV